MKTSAEKLFGIVIIVAILILVFAVLSRVSARGGGGFLPLIIGDVFLFAAGLVALYLLRGHSKTSSEVTLKWLLVAVLLVERIPNVLLLLILVSGWKAHGIITHLILFHGNWIFKSVGSLLGVVLLFRYVKQKNVESDSKETLETKPETAEQR